MSKAHVYRLCIDSNFHDIIGIASNDYLDRFDFGKMR